jgi:hypothetical protein
MAEQQVDTRYYQVATPGSLAERLVIRARREILATFLRETAAGSHSTIVDVGVSDVVGDAANALERDFPHPQNITAAGLGEGAAFRAAFPTVAYHRIEAGAPLPFPDRSFDIATANAVLEHVGSPEAQRRFVAELARVGRVAFLAVPHRFFPVEHHTGLPLAHWSDATFRLACRLTGKQDWAQPENLILMSRSRLRALWPHPGARIGTTGIGLGPFSSNLYLLIGAPRRD